MQLVKTERIEWQDVVKGAFKIAPRYPLSKNSVFEDKIWDFNDQSKQRLNSITATKLTFPWELWTTQLNSEIVEDIKIIVFFLLKVPRVFSNTKKNVGKGYKVNSIVSMISTLVRFLVHLLKERSIQNVCGENESFISTLEDITIEDLDEGTNSFEFRQDGLKQSLLFLCSPVGKQYVKYPVTWLPVDLDNLVFDTSKRKKTLESYSDQPLDDMFFRFLSKKATEDVCSFLKKSGIKCQVAELQGIDSNGLFDSYNNLSQMFDDYVSIRLLDKEHSLKLGMRRQGSNIERKLFKEKYNITVNEFSKKLTRVQRAAIYLLLQYTGTRYSEGISFKFGCLRTLDTGQVAIVGTQTKFVPTNIPIDKDQWIACPIVIDAVKVLEEISRFTFNHFLVSNIFAVYYEKDLEPMSLTGLVGALSDYVNEIDLENRFKDKAHKISPHRLRHTLALHMIRAELGIPYITYHLKHLHSAISSAQTVNNVTIGYGGISKEIFNNAVAMKQTKRVLAESLYHPDSPIEGGNKENFKRKREEYFQGMMLAGWEMDEILDHLASSSLPFADVGLGYCGGKKDVVYPSGKVEPPPCIGQLQCNPNQCHNAVITSEKIPIWKKVLEENKQKLQDPYMQHAKDIHLAFVNEAISVLKGLGVEIEEVNNLEMS
jgi:integrase